MVLFTFSLLLSLLQVKRLVRVSEDELFRPYFFDASIIRDGESLVNGTNLLSCNN